MGSKVLTLFSFHILHLLFFCGAKADSDPMTEVMCKLVNCGFGTCKASNTSLTPFDCDCSPGWKKLQIGSITLPPCIIPNCTLDFNCGAPPPPPPLNPPIFNISDPCSYTSCGDGTCVKAETELSGYKCQCNEGSVNLMNRTGLICLKKCSVGADCANLGLGLLNPPPPPPPPTPTPPSPPLLPPPPPPPPATSKAPTLNEDGRAKVDGNFARDRPVLTMLLLLATLIPWI